MKYNRMHAWDKEIADSKILDFIILTSIGQNNDVRKWNDF
jgi:hypothetical protein